MAETETELQQKRDHQDTKVGESPPAGEDDDDDNDFETVVRKRHSQKYRYYGGGGSMNGGGGFGRERDNDFTTFRKSRNNNRNFARMNNKPRGEFIRHRDSYGGGGEKDREKSTTSNNAVPSQQQPPTARNVTNSSNASSSISRSTTTTLHNNNNGATSNYLHVSSLKSSLVVMNGSICSESGGSSSSEVSSSLSSSSVHPSSSSSKSNGGLLDINGGDIIKIDHSRHISGGSIISGSASTCDHTDLAQINEESKYVMVVAPPPPVNPWKINPNAASVIAKRFLKPMGEEPSNANANTSMSQALGGSCNSQNVEKTVVDVSSDGAVALFAGGESKNKFNKKPKKTAKRKPRLPNNARSNKPDTEFKSCEQMDDKVKLQGDKTLRNSQGERSTDDGAASPIVDKSGESCDDSYSLHPDVFAIELEQLEMVQQPEPLMTVTVMSPAPPPEINPWLKNKNAVSVITKKIELNLSLPASNLPIAQLLRSSVSPPLVVNKKAHNTEVPRKQVVKESSSVSNTTAKIQKTTSASKTTPNDVTQTAITKSDQAKATDHSDDDDKIDGCSHIQSNKDIQPTQGHKFRRGFAAVTKAHSKINSKAPLSSTRNSPEDWPSLQTTAVVTVAQSKAKPVISLPISPEKNIMIMTGADSSGESSATTATTISSSNTTIEDKDRSLSLPDTWPSVSDSDTTQNCKESSLESGWHSGSDLNNEDTPSEASTGEMNNKDLPDEGNSINQGGSCASSDDQGVVDNELEGDGDADSGDSKKGKKSKQKWVKLDLPTTPSGKTRLREERQSLEKERKGPGNKEIDSQHQNDMKMNSKLSSNNDKDIIVNAKITNGPTNDVRSNVTYPSRGRGRGSSGTRGRTGKSRFGGQHWGYDRQENSSSEIIITTHVQVAGEEYQDFPPDYTTLPPLYPMTEFVMPYSNDPFYPTTPQGTVVDDAQLVSGYVPVAAPVLLDMVKKQIEYYFSEENLEKDFYLRRKMDQDGFLPLNFIATFPRVKIMTQDPAIVIQAIQASQNLELSEDFIFVRTGKTPEKWPIINDHSQGITSRSRIALALPKPQSLLTCPTIGNDLLSGVSNPILSPSGTNLNPNVAEFVPKSLLTVTLTAQ